MRINVFVQVVEEPARERLAPKRRNANDLKLAAEALARGCSPNGRSLAACAASRLYG